MKRIISLILLSVLMLITCSCEVASPTVEPTSATTEALNSTPTVLPSTPPLLTTTTTPSAEPTKTPTMLEQIFSSTGVFNESKKIVGTPQYLAPEIINGGKASPLSDIYSLGITFFELITGTVPFDSEDVHEILSGIISKDLPNIHLYRSSCPDNLAKIIYKACARNPKNRYQNVVEFKRDITTLLENKKNLRSQNWFERFFGLKGK